MAICSNCGRESQGDFTFCPHCAAPLGTARPPSEQRKTVTVLFCDVTGSTALGESTDPEALRSLLARYFERMKEIVERHGGTVEKFIGDAVMVVFGVPQVHEDDALRACRAALEMRDALPELGVQARIGLDTGEVVAGTEERLATGDAVNVAARLEQAAPPDEILLGEATVALVRDAVELERVEPLALRGKAEPVSAFRLVAIHEARERRHEVRFVGRTRELETLHQAWQRALDEERCELMTVVGDAGVGKSRLTVEFLTSLEAPVVRGRCLSYGDGITYWPVVEVVKQLDALPSDPAAAASIRSLLGESEQGTSAEEIAWAFRKVLEEQAPLVCLFDDIQWGEETFVDLIEHVALLSTGASILLLCLARPDLLDRRPVWPVALRLEPLSEADVDELIPEHTPAGVREKIRHAAGGNPLFLTEIVAMAREAEGAVVVPPTLQALLAARLDQLERAERSVLERGAVEGEIFHRGAVQALSEDGQVTPQLASLVRKELIRPHNPQLPGDDAFRFRHILIRDAAYDALAKSTRAELHERVADWLDERGQALVERHEIVGYHLEQAYRARSDVAVHDVALDDLGRRAARSLAAAGRRAAARDDVPAALNLLERALVLLVASPDDRLRANLLLDVGSFMMSAGRFGEVRQVLEEAATLAADLGDRRLELRAQVEHAFLDVFLDTETASMRIEGVAGVLPELEQLGDDLGVAKAWHLLSEPHVISCEWGRRSEMLERGLLHARQTGDRRLVSSMAGQLCVALLFGPAPVEEAIERCEALLEETRLGALSTLAALHAMRGEFERARSMWKEAAQGYEDLGLRFRRAARSVIGAQIERLAGDPEAAAEELRFGEAELEAMGERGVRSTIAAYLADVLYEAGRNDEALRSSERSEELVEPDDLGTQVVWRCARAKVLAEHGDHEAAERLTGEAELLAEPTEFPDLQASAHASRARVLTLTGRKDEARACLVRAHEIYARKGNVVATRQTDELLADRA